MDLFIRIPSTALLLLLVFDLTIAQTAYESIFTLNAFALQQTCVQNCFTQGYANIDCYTDVLGSMLGCPNTPCSSTFAAVDDCYCRGDLQTAAHDWLSTCIEQLCSVGDNAVNLATAASIYSGYCTARGFMAQPASNTAETTLPGGDSVSATASTGTGPTSAGSISSTSTTSSSSTSTSTSNTLTIALASVIGVAAIAILALGITCWNIRRKKKAKLETPSLYNLGPYPSTDLLNRPVGPWDSVSQIGSHVAEPAMMGPFYPSNPEPSMASTNARSNGASMAGSGRSGPRR